MPGPCDGLRVIDLSSGPLGGIVTMVLADYGADVVKVERPGGDPWRRLAAWPLWLRGKRSAVLDLRAAEGRAQLARLAAGADVVVASFRPGSAEALGADYATLSAASPGLVYCSLTGWGPRGPYAHYPAYEGLVAAKSGRMLYFAGHPRREGPAFCAVPVGTHSAAQSAVTGILAALLARERDGLGQLVESSLLQGMFAPDLFGLGRAQLAERFPQQFGIDPYATYGLPTLQYLPVVTKDGRWIQLANLLEHHFHAFIAAIDLGEIYADERFMGAPTALDLDAREELRNRILRRMQERTLDEWMAKFVADPNVGAEPFVGAQQGLYQADLVANGEVVEVDHPRLGRVRQVGLLADLAATPGAVGGPAPEVGEHTAEVLAGSFPQREGRAPRAVARGGDGADRPPLDGVTIVDFATIIATPLGIASLADLGARVIKVEPLEGDPYRGMGGGFGMYIGISKTSQGKESICIDLKRAEGRAIAERILRTADLVVQNFRPGVAERLGIGYEQVRKLNPEVIYLHCTGYGLKGPNALSVAAHPIPGAGMGGALYQAGGAMPPAEAGTLDDVRETSRWLYRANEGNPDPNSAMVVGTAAALALYAKQRTGRGQFVAVDMLCANAYANADDFLAYEGMPPRTLVDAELHGLHALYRLYRARSGWVFLAAPADAEWRALCTAAGRADLLDDPRFATTESRRAHDGALAEVLGALFATRDADEWESLLIAANVGCVRADAAGPGQFFAQDEQLRANGFAVEAEHAMWGRYQRWGPMVTLSRTPGRYGPGVLAGQHTDTILREFGHSDADVERLRSERVVTSESVPALGAEAPATPERKSVI